MTPYERYPAIERSHITAFLQGPDTQSAQTLQGRDHKPPRTIKAYFTHW